MPGGPLYPHSIYPVTTGQLFPNVHAAASGTSIHDEGLGVQASVTSNATWRLRYQMPPTLPSGAPKFLIRSIANAAAGVAKLNMQWAMVPASASPGAQTLNAEGTTTITWNTNSADIYIETKVSADAGTVNAGQAMAVDAVWESSGWTLAAVSTHQIFVIWE